MTLLIDTRYEIVDGPSEDSLFNSIRNKPCPCCGKSWNDSVQFQLIVSHANDYPEAKDRVRRLSAKISGIQREDGSGESWNITGHIAIHLGTMRFKGYYSSKNRKGHLLTL